MTRQFQQACRFNNDVYLGTDTQTLEQRLQALEVATGLREPPIDYTDISIVDLKSAIKTAVNGNTTCTIDTNYRLIDDADSDGGIRSALVGVSTFKFSHFTTADNISLSQLFYYCIYLTSLDVSKFDTSKVTDMDYMFASCNSLTSLDVSSFDVSNVTTMRYIFAYSTNITTITATGAFMKKAITYECTVSDSGTYISSAEDNTVYNFTGSYDSTNTCFKVTGRTTA